MELRGGILACTFLSTVANRIINCYSRQVTVFATGELDDILANLARTIAVTMVDFPV